LEQRKRYRLATLLLHLNSLKAFEKRIWKLWNTMNSEKYDEIYVSLGQEHPSPTLVLRWQRSASSRSSRGVLTAALLRSHALWFTTNMVEVGCWERRDEHDNDPKRLSMNAPEPHVYRRRCELRFVRRSCRRRLCGRVVRCRRAKASSCLS